MIAAPFSLPHPLMNLFARSKMDFGKSKRYSNLSPIFCSTDRPSNSNFREGKSFVTQDQQNLQANGCFYQK